MLDGLLKWYLETTDVTPLAEGATAAYIFTTFDPCLPRKQDSSSSNCCCATNFADNVGYPTNHSQRIEELWWQKFNPLLHTQYQTMTVDGHPLDGEH